MWPSARPFALSPTVFTFASKPTASTIYILAAGRVAVCQDLRARRRDQPNRIHLPMTLSKKVRCASVQGGRLPRLRWQGAAAPRLPARQPANHRPPPQRRISVLPISALSHFAICVHLCPSVAHRQLPSQKLRAIQPPPRTRQRLGVRWPSTAFPFRPDQLPTDDCPLPTSPTFPLFLPWLNP